MDSDIRDSDIRDGFVGPKNHEMRWNVTVRIKGKNNTGLRSIATKSNTFYVIP
jgi:hypothetical protein